MSRGKSLSTRCHQGNITVTWSNYTPEWTARYWSRVLCDVDPVKSVLTRNEPHSTSVYNHTSVNVTVTTQCHVMMMMMMMI